MTTRLFWVPDFVHAPQVALARRANDELATVARLEEVARAAPGDSCFCDLPHAGLRIEQRRGLGNKKSDTIYGFLALCIRNSCRNKERLPGCPDTLPFLFSVRFAKRPRGTPRPPKHLSVRQELSVREVPPDTENNYASADRWLHSRARSRCRTSPPP